MCKWCVNGVESIYSYSLYAFLFEENGLDLIYTFSEEQKTSRQTKHKNACRCEAWPFKPVRELSTGLAYSDQSAPTPPV